MVRERSELSSSSCCRRHGGALERPEARARALAIRKLWVELAVSRRVGHHGRRWIGRQSARAHGTQCRGPFHLRGVHVDRRVPPAGWRGQPLRCGTTLPALQCGNRAHLWRGTAAGPRQHV